MVARAIGQRRPGIRRRHRDRWERPPPPPRPTEAALARLLRLQGVAGNRAVSRLIADGPPDGVRGDADVLVPGSGRPLRAPVREEMEERLGHPLGSVRLHADAGAASRARTVRARAYTVGEDVVWGDERQDPEEPEARPLLLHELVHVVQQRSAARAPGDAGAAEREAEAVPVAPTGGRPAIAEAAPAGAAQGSWREDALAPVREAEAPPGPEREERVEEASEELERAAGMIADARSLVGDDRSARRRLDLAEEALRVVNGRLGEVLGWWRGERREADAEAALREVARCADALERVDDAREPDRAARAAGELLAALAELADDAMPDALGPVRRARRVLLEARDGLVAARARLPRETAAAAGATAGGGEEGGAAPGTE